MTSSANGVLTVALTIIVIAQSRAVAIVVRLAGLLLDHFAGGFDFGIVAKNLATAPAERSTDSSTLALIAEHATVGLRVLPDSDTFIDQTLPQVLGLLWAPRVEQTLHILDMLSVLVE